MSCGVPIVGYANEAMAGIKAFSGCGWTTPMNAPRELAHAIARLSPERQELASMSRRAVALGLFLPEPRMAIEDPYALDSPEARAAAEKVIVATQRLVARLRES
jgi:colanic acid/amylovoran biosynthesis glycosyltransferase